MHPLLSPRHWIFPLSLLGVVVTIHLLWPGYEEERIVDYTALTIIALNTVLRVLSPRPIIGRIALLVQCIVTLFCAFFVESVDCSGGIAPRVSLFTPIIPLMSGMGILQESVDVMFFIMYVAVMIVEPIVVGVSLYDLYMWYTSRGADMMEMDDA